MSKFSRSKLVVYYCCFFALSVTQLQANQISPAQLETLKRLSPEEQKALAASAGVDLNNLKAGAKQEASPAVAVPKDPVPRKPETPKKDVLKPFGYDLFAAEPSTFAPAAHIPIPVDYVVGPGDNVIVQLYGKDNATYELQISREGVLNFPEIGPISINGLNFSELKARLNELVAEQMIGIKASITMGALRSMQIFVLGEAHRPGAYTVSALSTITHALFVSGGVNSLASLRNIQLKRKGKVIQNFDLYDLLLKGDTSKDERLQPGDVVFIPPVKYTAGISGAVKRPAIYEFKSSINAAELVKMAGGYTPTAFPSVSKIDRINAQGERTIIDLDLKKNKKKPIRVGDVLHVHSILDRIENTISVRGHVHRPGGFKWTKGMRVSSVIKRIADLKPNPDTAFAIIERTDKADGRLSVLSFNLGAALANKKGVDDLLLRPRDVIRVFGHAEDHADALQPLVQALIGQTKLNNYPRVVNVRGHVRYSGPYPLTQNMTVEDLIAAAGGLLPDADYQTAILVSKNRQTLKSVTSTFSLRQPIALGRVLKPQDELFLFGMASSRQEIVADLVERLKREADKTHPFKVVSIGGAVKYPGNYPLISDMSAATLIDLAGGFKETAYNLSGEITRKKIDDQQNYSIEHLPVKLSNAEILSTVALLPRDHLVIKQIPKWDEERKIHLKGEIKFPGEYPITDGETLSQLIKRAGGLTQFADAYGTIFLRESLKQREEEVLARYRSQLDKQMLEIEKKAAAGDDEISEAKLAGAALLDEITDAKPSGRLVIDMPSIIAGKPGADLVLRDGDEIVVPSIIQEVSVLGEVQHPTSHLFVSKLSGKGYLNLSGGYSVLSDKKRAYVIERNGSVKPLKKRILWVFKKRKRIKPGDTIVVPPDLDRVAPLTYWSQVSQVLFQLATTAAALETVGAL